MFPVCVPHPRPDMALHTPFVHWLSLLLIVKTTQIPEMICGASSRFPVWVIKVPKLHFMQSHLHTSAGADSRTCVFNHVRRVQLSPLRHNLDFSQKWDVQNLSQNFFFNFWGHKVAIFSCRKY